MILATFSSCCCRGFCCCCWSPDGKTPWQWRTEKPQNCTPKMPNVTSETHRKWWFWRLFPLAAAMNMKFGYLFLLLVPGQENTIVTSETHRKRWFWLFFPLAAAMNFGFCCCWSPFENHRKRWFEPLSSFCCCCCFFSCCSFCSNGV